MTWKVVGQVSSFLFVFLLFPSLASAWLDFNYRQEVVLKIRRFGERKRREWEVRTLGLNARLKMIREERRQLKRDFESWVERGRNKEWKMRGIKLFPWKVGMEWKESHFNFHKIPHWKTDSFSKLSIFWNTKRWEAVISVPSFANERLLSSLFFPSLPRNISFAFCYYRCCIIYIAKEKAQRAKKWEREVREAWK